MEEVVKNTNRVQEGKKCFCAPPLFVLKGHGVRLNFGGFYLLDEHNLGPKKQ